MPNPYHAKNGRFTTKGGAAMTVGTAGLRKSIRSKTSGIGRNKTYAQPMNPSTGSGGSTVWRQKPGADNAGQLRNSNKGLAAGEALRRGSAKSSRSKQNVAAGGRATKTVSGLERFDKNGRSVFPGKPVYPDSPKIGVRASRIDDVTQSGRSRKTEATPIRRGNSVSGYKIRDSLENGYGSGNKNAGGDQTRTKRINNRTVRDRSNSLKSPPEPIRSVPAKRPELRLGASADQKRRRRRASANDGADAIGQMNYEAIAGGANPYESGARFRKVPNDGYPAGASGGNMTRAESNKYHADMARKDGRSGAPRSKSNRSVGARLDVQDSWKTNQKKPKKVSGSRFPLGGRLPF